MSLDLEKQLEMIRLQGDSVVSGFIDGCHEAPEDVYSMDFAKQAAYIMGLRLGKSLVRGEMALPFILTFPAKRIGEP